jgi:hypothetical protein
MKASVGDWLVVESQTLDRPRRQGEIVEVRQPDGSPPYRVRWAGDDHESLVFPGPEAHIEHQPATPSGGPQG